MTRSPAWTTPADLRAQVQRLWDKGDLLRALLQQEPIPPLRLRLTTPSSTELTERFDDVRAWMKTLAGAKHYRVELREFRHRVLGACAVPDQVWLDTLDDALAVIGRHKDAQRFAHVVQHTCMQQSALLPWLAKRPLVALELADAWPRLLAVVAWLQAYPRPGIYLRQVDVPGVDSKFIEAHRGVLGELLDLALPAPAIDASATGAGRFCQRYGFKDKPLRIRFRLLDAALGTHAHGLLSAGADSDITLTQADFAQLDLPLQRVFITENEVNFLAFPAQSASMVIFGAGYGFDALAPASWLHACRLHYWGDIDTHGFAILDQLRAHFPQAQSLLMDQATLLAHPGHWGEEPQPTQRELTRLTEAEAALYGDLCRDSWGQRLRLEQERIAFACLELALAELDEPKPPRATVYQ
ncbi:MAG: Wadjet anti-phage system protein JetD domain-containing protein [Rhodoferax sp.]